MTAPDLLTTALAGTPFRASRLVHQGKASAVWAGEGAGGQRVAIRAYQTDPFDLERKRDWAEPGEVWNPLVALESAVPPLVGLDHPHLATILFARESNGGYVIVERFAEGVPPSIAAPTPPRDAARLVAQVARAAGAIHQRDRVHGGIRPSRVLVAGGRATLVAAGWGAVASSNLDMRFMDTEATPMDHDAWGSPEQMRWEPPAAPSDVFSLGTLLYALLSGAHPFRARDLHFIRERVRVASHQSLQERDPSLPAPLVAAVEKALAVKPADRFGSGAALADALDAALA